MVKRRGDPAGPDSMDPASARALSARRRGRRVLSGRGGRRRRRRRFTRLSRNRGRNGRLARLRRWRLRDRVFTFRPRLSVSDGQLQLRIDRVRLEPCGRRFHADKVFLRGDGARRYRVRLMVREREAHGDVGARRDRQRARRDAAASRREFRLGAGRIGFKLEGDRLRSLAAERRGLRRDSHPASSSPQAATATNRFMSRLFEN